MFLIKNCMSKNSPDRWRAPLVVLAVMFGLGMMGIDAIGAPPLEMFGVPAIHKITPAELPAPNWQKGRISVECARNEWEAIQVVARTTVAVDGLAFRMSDLRSQQGGVLAAKDIRLRRVEWVDVNAPVEPGKLSTNPDLQPDPLVPLNPTTDRFNMEPGRNLVFWVLVGVPESAAAGLYEGEVSLSTSAAPQASLHVSLRVRDFALPRRPTLQSMIGLTEDDLYRAHGCRTAAEKEAVVRLYFEEYIRARLSPFLYAPSTIAFNPLPGGRINWEFDKGPNGALTGEVKMNFAGFDREADNYLNQRHAFSAFNIAPYLWARREKFGKKATVLRISDSANTVVERVDADGAINPLFDRLVVAVFRQIAAHLDQKGWLDRAVYYVTDEPADDDVPAIKQICLLVRQADPRLRTALTHDPATQPRLAELADDKGRSLISVWIPYCSLYREDVAARERAKGAEYWLYDIGVNSFITDTGLANRAMFWTVWQRDAKGYLYYLSTYWGRDLTPWDRPNFELPGVSSQYRHGSGYFFYPPQRRYNPEPPVLDKVVTTIRWELMREGVEDYDTLRLLEGLTAQAERRGMRAAKVGRETLALARSQAENISSSLAGASIADLDFAERKKPALAIPGTGWRFSDQNGWLQHRGGHRVELPISFSVKVPDGQYDLIMNVYSDSDYQGRSYSSFQVDGRSLTTTSLPFKGATDVNAGEVEVKDGMCRFILSSADGGDGVILYRVVLRRHGADDAAEFYTVRTRVADAIEQIQAALGGEP